jgi:hypothetical protein
MVLSIPGLWRLIEAHPVRTVALVFAGVTLAVLNVKLVAAGGPWWRGWLDQQALLESARALMTFDFAADRHWYPLLYPLTGAPFAWMPAPFVPANIACFALAFRGFLKISARFGVGPGVAVLLFLFATLGPGIGHLWIEPWSTTLSAALIWALFACAGALLFGEGSVRTAAATGALLMLVALARPVDAVICAAVAPFAVWRPLREGRFGMIGAAAGGIVVLAVYALLHFAIHGARLSDYVELSRQYGFNLADLGWKAQILLVSPRPWFPDGEGLLAAMPWLIVGVAGMVLAAIRLSGGARALAAMLGLAALGYCVLLLAYVDLLPSGLWRFHLLHYFKWLFPLLALFAWLFVRWAREAWRPAAAVLAGMVLLTGLRVEPVPATENEPARMLAFPATGAAWAELYHARAVVRDAQGILRNGFDYREIAEGKDVMAVALKRPFAPGIAEWTGDPAPSMAEWPAVRMRDPVLPGNWPQRPLGRWKERLTYGYPCWLPPWPCG